MKRPLRRQIPTAAAKAATAATSQAIAELLRVRGCLSFNAYLSSPPPDAAGYSCITGGQASRWLLNRGALGDPEPI